MHTVSQVKTGLLKYINQELLPEMTQLGEVMLTNFCDSKAAQLFGIAGSNGTINIEALRNVCNHIIPDDGVAVSIMGVEMRFTRKDIDTIYKLIKEA